MSEIGVFVKVNEEKERDIAKLIHFIKSRKKAEAFKEALIIASQNDKFVKKYVNNIFIEDFKKIAKKIKEEKYEKN